MPALVAGIHAIQPSPLFPKVFLRTRVDSRNTSGHDEYVGTESSVCVSALFLHLRGDGIRNRAGAHHFRLTRNQNRRDHTLGVLDFRSADFP